MSIDKYISIGRIPSIFLYEDDIQIFLLNRDDIFMLILYVLTTSMMPKASLNCWIAEWEKESKMLAFLGMLRLGTRGTGPARQ